MKLKIFIPILALLVGLTAIPGMAKEEENKTYEVGSTVKPFTLKDQNGKEHDLGKVLGKKVVVLSFWSCQCPVSKAYEDRLIALDKKYDDKKVAVFAIDSNKINDIERIKEYAKKHKLTYPVLKDWENKIADTFGAKVTPELYIIGKDKKVKYHGAFDDSQNPKRVEKHLVPDALAAVVAGKDVKVKKHKAFGCSIKRVN